MQTLLHDPIPFTVQLLNDGVAAETEETLTLTLTEDLGQERFQNEFLLGRVVIRIRDINSMYIYSYNTKNGMWYAASGDCGKIINYVLTT